MNIIVFMGDKHKRYPECDMLGAVAPSAALMSVFFCVIGNFIGIPYYTKSPTGQDFLLLPENGKEEQRWIKMIILL